MLKVKLIIAKPGEYIPVVDKYAADVILEEIEDHPGYKVRKSKYGQHDLFQPGKIVEKIDE